MNKRLWIVLAVLVVAVIGGLVWWKTANPDGGNGNTSYISFLDGKTLLTEQKIIDAQNKAANDGKLVDGFKPAGTIIPDHFVGKVDSKVVVVQYEDFACSACIGFNVDNEQIRSDYQDRVLFIYRNFSIGQNTSTPTQSAAEAAFLLGGVDAYWKMNNLIFSDTTCIEGADVNTCEEKIRTYAKQIGLDVDKFNQYVMGYRDNGIKAKMDRDKQLGLAAGVSATPTWFINGEKVEGGNNQKMRDLIDAALAK